MEKVIKICDTNSGLSVSSPAVKHKSQMDGLTVYLNGQSDGSSFLGKLPSVVLVNIFRFVDNKNELLRLASVCRSWRDLIYTTPTLWRNMHLEFCCNCKCLNRKTAFSNVKRFGCHLYELSISICEHHKYHVFCNFLVIDLRKLLLSLHHSTLKSVKIDDIIVLETSCRTMSGISRDLTSMVSRLDRLQCFKMTKSQWPIEEGNNLINTVLTTSRGTLQSLDIDRFFHTRLLAEKPVKLDQLTTGILSLTRLTKLGIDYILLTDDFVTSLSRSHAGQLQKLKLMASAAMNQLIPKISSNCWEKLTEACPAMKVAFYVDGWVFNFLNLNLGILDPVLPIYKIRILNLARCFTMATVLTYITTHFSKSLVQLDGNLNSFIETIDADFLNLVRECLQLIYINVSGYFRSQTTVQTAMRLIRERNRRHNMKTSQGPPNKRAKTGPVNGQHSTPAIGSHSTPAHGPHSTLANGPHSTPAHGPHSTPAHGPHSTLANGPHSTPANGPHSTLANGPHSTPANGPHSTPANGPHSTPANGPYLTPANGPHSTPANGPHSTPANGPHSTPANGPHSTPANDPHSTPANGPHSTPANGPHSTLVNGPHSTPANGPHSTPANDTHSILANGPHSTPANGPHSTPTNGPHSTPANLAAARSI
ncbi:uncharacterized protein LOC131940674 [Physella acuta]|uniref:uncharacterized protein LOC131940674 n=1 Tax=Physella acuta TaxID=109671 RepID=UPI0027DB6B2E|nr:uncharacterized protein LOC131940674 [Physella acuta]